MKISDNFSRQSNTTRNGLPNRMRRSGKLIYNESQNPYETIEVYLDTGHGFIVKCLISDCAPGEGYSWNAVYIDEENLERLKKLVYGDIEVFLKSFWLCDSGMTGFSQFLTKHGIAYDSQWYL